MPTDLVSVHEVTVEVDGMSQPAHTCLKELVGHEVAVEVDGTSLGHISLKDSISQRDCLQDLISQQCVPVCAADLESQSGLKDFTSSSTLKDFKPQG
eukprot:12417684-Karenia_brevis.AAC.1